MKYKKRIIILVAVIAALAIPVIIFFTRAPILIVTDALFTALYGEERIQQQRRWASLTLFRQVKPVMVADGASPDMIMMAIFEAASRPYMVLFSNYHSAAAQRFHTDFPATPAVLISGISSPQPSLSPGELFHVYTIDLHTDMYRAGILLGILAGLWNNPEQQAESPIRHNFAVWADNSVTSEHHELFAMGVREEDPEASVVFANRLSDIPDAEILSGLVLTVPGGEYFNNNPQMPVILFSWLNPGFTPREVSVQFDDSPWGMIVPAVRKAEQGELYGQIPSNVLVVSEKVADNGLFRMLRRASKKTP